ncbi:MAG: hypothetical protein H7Y43_09275 [Akkermansiaceae bacterium]|nr:hypothetical protein [Verrucomicrobiales bacterium]
MYYPQSTTALNPFDPNTGYVMAKKSSQLTVNRVAMSDPVATYEGIPHRSSKNPNALNVLWGDGHAKVCTTKAAFNVQL